MSHISDDPQPARLPDRDNLPRPASRFQPVVIPIPTLRRFSKKRSASARWPRANRCPRTREPASGPPDKDLAHRQAPRPGRPDRCSTAFRWWPFWLGSGLGADGLSSSCYGPPEVVRPTFKEHAPYLVDLSGAGDCRYGFHHRLSVTATSLRSFPAAAADTWLHPNCLATVSA